MKHWTHGRHFLRLPPPTEGDTDHCPYAPLRGRQGLSGSQDVPGSQDMPGSQDWAMLRAKMQVLYGGDLCSHVDGLSGRSEADSEGEFVHPAQLGASMLAGYLF